jgi:hypothetical protein
LFEDFLEMQTVRLMLDKPDDIQRDAVSVWAGKAHCRAKCIGQKIGTDDFNIFADLRIVASLSENPIRNSAKREMKSEGTSDGEQIRRLK